MSRRGGSSRGAERSRRRDASGHPGPRPCRRVASRRSGHAGPRLAHRRRRAVRPLGAGDRTLGRQRLGVPPRWRPRPRPGGRRLDGARGIQPSHCGRTGTRSAHPRAAGAAGASVHVCDPLCRGIALGLDWPDDERRILVAGAGAAAAFEEAACVVGPPGPALRAHRRGASCIVVAPPGDPFWNGTLPERAFVRLRVVRSHPRTGWEGASRTVLDALDAFRSGEAEEA